MRCLRVSVCVCVTVPVCLCVCVRTAHTRCAEPSCAGHPALDTPCVGHPGPPCAGPPCAGPHNISLFFCFFFPSPATNVFLFFSLLGLSSLNCGRDSRPCADHLKCAFGLRGALLRNPGELQAAGTRHPFLPLTPSRPTPFGPLSFSGFWSPTPLGSHHDTHQNDQSGLAKNGLTQNWSNQDGQKLSLPWKYG